MCGIAGIIRFDGRPVDATALDRACRAMAHRGPDDAGTWYEHADGFSIGMAAVRLAVQDTSPAGHQPMHDAAGRYVLVYNGELYNGETLRDDLRAAGVQFQGHSDTEIILHACARWGVDALPRFNGMFALAFLDRTERTGFLARDRFGIKPLVIAGFSGGICFASEVGTLTCFDGWDRAIDPDAVTQHLRYGYVAAPRSIYRNVHRLPPGCTVRFDPRRCGEPSATINPRPAAGGQPVRSYPDATRRIREALRESVIARKISDVPIGAFLSGGLDSSIIVAHLSEAVGGRLKTFAIGHADQRAYDESRYALLVARAFDTDHYEHKLTTAEVIDAVPAILDHLGEPVGDSSIIPTTLVSRFARRHVTVALSGDGGDELFGGYYRYAAQRSVETYSRLPQVLRRGLIEPILNRLPVSKSSAGADRVRQFRKMLRGVDQPPLVRHLAWSRIMSPSAEGLFDDPRRGPALDDQMLSIAHDMAAPFDSDPVQAILAFDVQHGLPSDMLHKVDLASMSCSLEVRVPFLDPAVVQIAFAIPSEWKIDRGQRKRVLVDAYRGTLPDEVLDRPKKGFEVPFGEYVRGPLRELYRDTVTAEALARYEGVNAAAAERILEEHLCRRGEHADLLFALLTLCWKAASGA